MSSQFYLKYLDLLEDPNTNELLTCLEYDEAGEPILITTKENVESLHAKNNKILTQTRLSILRYLYIVWVDGVQVAPPEWWCEMSYVIKDLVVLSTCMESLTSDLHNPLNPEMEIPQVLLKLWDYIKIRQTNNNWSYIMDEYEDLCKKHNDLRELYFI
jgi:hypothetical protein